jgi:hypothetical protein
MVQGSIGSKHLHSRKTLSNLWDMYKGKSQHALYSAQLWAVSVDSISQIQVEVMLDQQAWHISPSHKAIFNYN